MTEQQQKKYKNWVHSTRQFSGSTTSNHLHVITLSELVDELKKMKFICQQRNKTYKMQHNLQITKKHQIQTHTFFINIFKKIRQQEIHLLEGFF